MKKTFRAGCDRFVENRNNVKAAFRWSSPMMHCLCALQMAAAGKPVSAAELLESKQQYKSVFGSFSVFRGIAVPTMITLTALQKNKTNYPETLTRAFSALRAAGFRPTDYQPISAWLLAQKAEGEWESYAHKARSLYLDMREKHPLLTAGEDACFALLLALETKDGAEALTLAEDAYALLRERFGTGNAAQTMSHILALGEGDLSAHCGAVIALYDALHQNTCRFYRGIETAMLAILALFEQDTEQLTAELAETAVYLWSHKGFSAFALGRNQRAFYVASLLAIEKAQTLPDGSRESMLRLIQTTMSVVITLAAIAAASAAIS